MNKYNRIQKPKLINIALIVLIDYISNNLLNPNNWFTSVDNPHDEYDWSIGESGNCLRY